MRRAGARPGHGHGLTSRVAAAPATAPEEPRMELFYADLSPYARKVRVVVAEKGLDERVTLTAVNPYEAPERLHAANPLCKVPTLVTDDGGALFDSPVICEYLDTQGTGPRLLPPQGRARFDVLRRNALVNGIMDVAFALACEVHRREPHERSQKWIQHWCTTILRSADALEAEIGDWPDDIDMAQVTAGCVLAYLDVRLANQVDWRAGHPELAAWYEEFSKRPSMVASAPRV